MLSLKMACLGAGPDERQLAVILASNWAVLSGAFLQGGAVLRCASKRAAVDDIQMARANGARRVFKHALAALAIAYHTRRRKYPTLPALPISFIFFILSLIVSSLPLIANVSKDIKLFYGTSIT